MSIMIPGFLIFISVLRLWMYVNLRLVTIKLRVTQPIKWLLILMMEKVRAIRALQIMTDVS